MNDNVIVLTTGLSGSSVTTALLAQSKLWLGRKTIVKNNSSGHYDTYENAELVQMNQKLYDTLKFKPEQSSLYDEKVFNMFANCHKNIDLKPFEDFILDCNENGPWLWKDPRLWNTIGFWLPLLEEHCGKSIRFVVLSRQPLSLWVSLLLKRNIISYDYLRKSEYISCERLKSFIAERGFMQFELNYNELLSKPSLTINQINDSIGTNLKIADLETVFNGKLPASPWKWRDLFTASLIYIKNRKDAVKD